MALNMCIITETSRRDMRANAKISPDSLSIYSSKGCESDESDGWMTFGP